MFVTPPPPPQYFPPTHTRHHTSVLQFFGLCTTSDASGDKHLLVTEYARGGSLRPLVLDQHKLCDRFPGMRTTIASQVAHGMQFLHAKGVIHFDLKPDNILMREPVASLRSLEDLHVQVRVLNSSVLLKFKLNGNLN